MSEEKKWSFELGCEHTMETKSIRYGNPYQNRGTERTFTYKSFMVSFDLSKAGSGVFICPYCNNGRIPYTIECGRIRDDQELKEMSQAETAVINKKLRTAFILLAIALVLLCLEKNYSGQMALSGLLSAGMLINLVVKLQDYTKSTKPEFEQEFMESNRIIPYAFSILPPGKHWICSNIPINGYNTGPNHLVETDYRMTWKQLPRPGKLN